MAVLTNASINETYGLGDTAMLECISSGGPNNTYQWQDNGRDLEGRTLPILAFSNITAETGGMYTCVVSNLAGSHNASTYLFIDPYFVSHPGDMQVSVGDTVVLACGVEAFPNPEYLWQRADGREIRNGIVSHERNLTITSIQFGDQGAYYCNASSNNEMPIQSRNGIITGIHHANIALRLFRKFNNKEADNSEQ